MKNFLYVIMTALLAVSCLGDGPSTSRSYSLLVDFEYNDEVFISDSVRFEATAGVAMAYYDMAFYHKLDPQKTAVLGGFAVSRLKGSDYNGGRNEFRVNSGAGADNSRTYAVFKYDKTGVNMPQHDIEFINRNYGTCTMAGLYVNNTYEMVEYVKNNFTDGDKVCLKATGYLDGAETGKAEIVLAEYTDKKDSLIVKWTPFDLAKLGKVQYVELELVGVKDGMPSSVCIDNVVSKISIQY